MIKIENILKINALFLCLALIFPTLADATGPRVTGALFATDKTEIYAVDTPPFISTEVLDGGVTTEIVDRVLALAGIDLEISMLPLQRMTRYYLDQEGAVAVMGRHFNFSSNEKKKLIFIPVTVSAEKYFYYKASYPDGLAWKGDLSNLKGKRYGAYHGEDISAYKQAGIDVSYGRTVSLLKKLMHGEIDFFGAPELTVDWVVKHYLSGEKGNVVAMNQPAEDEPIYIIFNSQHPDGMKYADSFRQALSKLISDGSYLEILKKYMGDQRALAYMKRMLKFHH